MNIRPYLAFAVLFATTSAFAEDFPAPKFTCLTEANSTDLLLQEYPEVQLYQRTEAARVYLAKRDGRLYRIELDACTTETKSIQRVLPKT